MTAAALDKDLLLAPFQDLGIHFEVTGSVMGQKVLERLQQVLFCLFFAVFCVHFKLALPNLNFKRFPFSYELMES